MKRACVVCEFKDMTYVHHVIPLSQEGDHCEENVVILCSNQHKMIHHSKLKEKVRLPKLGKKHIHDMEEIKVEKERDKALTEGANIIFQLSKEKDAKTRVDLSQNQGYLFEKYGFNYFDCISYIVGIKKESLLKNYIF